MKIKAVDFRLFKRFSHLQIKDISQTAKLVILTGPNGSGKSSLFDGFNLWYRKRRSYHDFDAAYFLRSNNGNQQTVFDNLKIEFHDFANTRLGQADFSKCFYIRSAYRHEPDFTSHGVTNLNDAIHSTTLINLMSQESRISENYNRIVGQAVLELFNNAQQSTTALEIRDRVIGEVRSAMSSLFNDLLLTGPGNPTNGGTFRFTKGEEIDFHFKNLSGGEKAAFDLLLDFIVKKQTFNNTVFCIDEPELHMHTKLQGKLLEQLFSLLPENCQLWISTHSIGMARKAAELNRNNPGQVAFIDFHDQNFDQAVTLYPVQPTRQFWKNMFNTALDDLAQLVVPANVVFCEGKRIGTAGRNPAFDVAVYSKVFGDTHPDAEFISLGGTNQVAADGKLSSVLLQRLAPGITIWSVFDRDDRTQQEIQELGNDRIKVLNRRDLESYLWDNEILSKLAAANNRTADAPLLIAEKVRLLSNLQPGIPIDDIKAIAGLLFNYCRQTLQLVQQGNNTEAFEINTLAPLITPETLVYQELEQIIFTPF